MEHVSLKQFVAHECTKSKEKHHYCCEHISNIHEHMPKLCHEKKPPPADVKPGDQCPTFNEIYYMDAMERSKLPTDCFD